MMEKFTVDEKVEIVMESFTANNIAELYRKRGVAVSNFYKWRDRFIESGKKGFYETSRGNAYEREINDLKLLVGDQALVIDELKKITEGGKD